MTARSHTRSRRLAAKRTRARLLAHTSNKRKSTRSERRRIAANRNKRETERTMALLTKGDR